MANKKLIELKKLVIEEATKLKKHLTKKEMNRLNYDSLLGRSYENCIYGQITGNCTSIRANKLIIKCCKLVYYSNDGYNNLLKKPCKILNADSRVNFYLSPMEEFLINYKPSVNVHSYYVNKLVSFLKDKNIEKLEL